MGTKALAAKRSCPVPPLNPSIIAGSMAKVGFVSLGCPKNLVDSEVMMGLLKAGGHEVTGSQREAEIIVVNTCGFIESAKQESIDTILEMAQEKKQGSCRRLIVTGCMVERYRQEILDSLPEVDAVVGTNELPGILRACHDPQETSVPVPPAYEAREEYLYSDTDPRVLTTPHYSAFVKIAEGCDHPCSFCVIPQMRGRFRSRPLMSVLAEIRRLAAKGVKEINLVGQDTTMYGFDSGDRHGLAHLLREAEQVDGIHWVRFLYAYPNNIYGELLDAVRECSKACNYFDIPLQHASRNILKEMKRGGNRGSLSRLVERIRERVPGVVIRTTMIVGFPGETDEDFQELLEFAEELKFDRLGAFCFSDEEHAGSYHLENKVPEEIKLQRQKSLMELQSTISRQLNQRLVGQTVPVLLEGISKESDMLWQGRTEGQAPDIDGVVYVTDGVTPATRSGEIGEVRVEEAHEYDLVGTLVQ